MKATSLANILGLLQHNAYDVEGWSLLERDSALLGTDAEARDEALRLLNSARRAHTQHLELAAAKRLAEFERSLVRGAGDELERLDDLLRFADEEALSDELVRSIATRIEELQPGHGYAESALAEVRGRMENAKELVATAAAKIEAAHDRNARAKSLLQAARTAWRSAQHEAPKIAAKLRERAVKWLTDAHKEAPTDPHIAFALEHLLRSQEDWDGVVELLEPYAVRVASRADQRAVWSRIGRVAQKQLKDLELSTRAYRQVFEIDPLDEDAMSVLVDAFTSSERWDDLVELYETRLRAGRGTSVDPGIAMQIAMLHWRMRNRPDLAEPYFEQLRASEPAHPGVLAFFRAWCAEQSQTERLFSILRDAERASSDPAARSELAAEGARLAEKSVDAKKAVESWRAVLRSDPKHTEARTALKRLYRELDESAPLIELLKNDLDATPSAEPSARATILREMAGLYRQLGKSETTLVTIYSQLTTLDPTDKAAFAELARIYESLSRWRDLLAVQAKLVALETSDDARVELLRAMARRWLEQFSNVQQATEAYEQLLSCRRGDEESRLKLRELYGKRRMYGNLYELLSNAMEGASPSERVPLSLELAKLAADKLDRGSDAIAWYKLALAEGAPPETVLDPLEKVAERDKNFDTVAVVLVRRIETAVDSATRASLFVRLAQIHQDRRNAPKEAREALRHALEAAPGNAKALRFLRDVVLKAHDREGATLFADASGDKGGDVDSATDALLSLSEGTDDEQFARELVALALERALQIEDERGRSEVLIRVREREVVLVPNEIAPLLSLIELHELLGNGARLLALYETRLATLHDPGERIPWLQKIRANALANKAEIAMRAAVEIFATMADRSEALKILTETASHTRRADPYAQALRIRLEAEGVSREERRALLDALVPLFADTLAKADEAIQFARAAFEDSPNDRQALQQYESLLRRFGRSDELRALYEERAARASASEQMQLLDELAELELTVFDEPERAQTLYRRMLDIDPTSVPARARLVSLLRSRGDLQGAGQLLETDVPGELSEARAIRWIQLAEIRLSAGHPSDALKWAHAASESAGVSDALIALYESLLESGEIRPKAAMWLVSAYEQTGAYDKEVVALDVCVATATSQRDRLKLCLTLAEVHEKFRRDELAALAVLLKVTAECPEHIEAWDRLAVIATHTGQTQTYIDCLLQAVPLEGRTAVPVAVEVDLAERIATLLEERLGEVERARAYLLRILDRAPNHPRAFLRLKQSLVAEERWEELAAIYDKVIEAIPETELSTDLLLEAAMFFDDIVQRRARAVELYELALRIDSSSAPAFAALDEAYARDREWSKLAALLEGRAGIAGVTVRLARLYLDELALPERAFVHLDAALGADPHDAELATELRRFLSIEVFKYRAAQRLESVFETTHDARQLVDVLEVLVSDPGAEADEMYIRLERLASLYERDLNDDGSALSALARLLVLDPSDGEVRRRLVETGRRAGDHGAIVRALANALSGTTEPETRVEYFLEMAPIQENFLSDAAGAEANYRAVVELGEPQEAALIAARELTRMYEARGAAEPLSYALEAVVSLVQNGTERLELLVRVGNLYQYELHNTDRALHTFERAREVHAEDTRVLEALSALYRQTEAWDRLVDVIAAQESTAHAGNSKRVLMLERSDVLSLNLRKDDDAAFVLRAIVDEFGPEIDVLARLATHLRNKGDAQGLDEVLFQWLDRETDLAVRREVRIELIELRISLLSQPERAMDLVSDAVADDPSGRGQALAERLLSVESVRLVAARLLWPVYLEKDAPEGQLRVVDVELACEGTPAERLPWLERAVTLSETRLHDSSRALAYAAKALVDANGEPSFEGWLDRAQTLSRAAGKTNEFEGLLAALLPDVLSDDLKFECAMRLGALREETKGQEANAIEAYRIAFGAQPDSLVVLDALARLYEATDNPEGLLEVANERAAIAGSTSQQSALARQRAELLIRLGRAPEAITALECALDAEFDPNTIRALDSLYTQQARHVDRITLIEREIEATQHPDARATLQFRIGDIALKELNDGERALDAFAAALSLDPLHDGTVSALEGLLAGSKLSPRAAELLESVYLAKRAWSGVENTLRIRFQFSDSEDERRDLLQRIARLREEQLENYRDALEAWAELLALDPHDERTWEQLARVSKGANAESRLAEIFATEVDKASGIDERMAELALRTGRLLDSQGKLEQAIKYYRSSYDYDPLGSDEAFAALDRILVVLARHEERIALLRRSLGDCPEPGERRRRWQLVAFVEEHSLAIGRARLRRSNLRFAMTIQTRRRLLLFGVCTSLMRTGPNLLP